MFNTAFKLNQTTVEDEVIVVRGTGEFLLGKPTAVALNALVLPDVTVRSPAEQLREKFPTVFRGVGKLKGLQERLHVDVDVPPVAQRRRIPYAHVQAVDKKLEELLSTDVIERTDGPTPWVSPVVITPKKNGDIRLCVDLRLVNEAIIRERRPVPTMVEILHEANGSTVFSKIDLHRGFHQMELEKSSRHLTTFVANGTSKTRLTFYGRGFCASDRTPTTTGSPAGHQSNENAWVLPPISRNKLLPCRSNLLQSRPWCLHRRKNVGVPKQKSKQLCHLSRPQLEMHSSNRKYLQPWGLALRLWKIKPPQLHRHLLQSVVIHSVNEERPSD